MQKLLEGYANLCSYFRTGLRQSIRTVLEILFEPKIYKETKKYNNTC